LSHSPPTNRRLPPCSVPCWARISGCDATLGLDTSHSEITTLDASSLGSISVSASPTWILAGPASTQTTGKTTTLVTQSSKTTLVQSVSTSSIVATSATPSTMMSVVRERAPIWRERNDIHKPMSFLRSAPTPAHPAWNQDTPALT
jgi:hypothetical protein